ncbi:MAG: ABC-F family ATP-binding cassette domain-containing protein [Halobacteriovoraceae bacterium]|nr:ABC-F family ATP-binding cassette domain-containing protein [Halobacteriovoraceae bacterium]MCB9095357.1 ABC-F family ATP-binding cassette domain-containing protein [Halobacteriovoraceae bacterium]
MSILLTLQNLNLTFGEKVIFDHAELTIHKGDRIGLIGLNGQGKSTLFNILQEKIRPDISTPAFAYDKSNEHFDIFLVPQELNIKDYKDLSIENYYLAFYPELYRIHKQLQEDYSQTDLFEKFEQLKGWEIQNSYVSYLKGFGMDQLDRSIENLSGGEKRKMAISIGLSSQAELILWDEPTNHLDIETIERIEDELLTSKKTFMIISHDRYLLNHTTDRIFHIERGKITNFKGTYLDYLEYLDEREAELKKNLDKLENRHRRELAWMHQGIKARGTRSKKRVEGFHNIQEGIKEIKSKVKQVVDLDLQHSGRKSKILLTIEDGSFSYGDRSIFESINLIVTKKNKIALMGPNGAGKTTLIKIMQEQLKLTSGHQKNLDGLKMIVFDQNRASLDDNKTPMEFLGEGNDFVTLGNGQKKHITSYLSDFLFDSNQAYRPISTLSGGEKNRLQLANFMKQAADLWVFDEPTNDLDIETIELLEKELKSYDAAVIIISHDRAFLDNTCKTTWIINDKNVEVFTGGYTQVAPYLHALELQKNQPDEKRTETQKSKDENKLTYADKKRLTVIEDEIHRAELALDKINESLAAFDFGDMNPETREQYESLNSDKSKSEQEVEELYREWEELSNKQ